jgi:hypothetical protein
VHPSSSCVFVRCALGLLLVLWAVCGRGGRRTRGHPHSHQADIQHERERGRERKEIKIAFEMISFVTNNPPAPPPLPTMRNGPPTVARRGFGSLGALKMPIAAGWWFTPGV